jgi:hypothetical protein
MERGLSGSARMKPEKRSFNTEGHEGHEENQSEFKKKDEKPLLMDGGVKLLSCSSCLSL